MKNELIFKNKIQLISKIINEEGITNFLIKVIRYINKNIFGIFSAKIIEIDLKKSIPKNKTKLKISFRTASEKDIDSMDEVQYGYNKSAKKYSKNQLKKGDKCILAIHRDKIIGYVWIMKDYMELSKKKHIILHKKRMIERIVKTKYTTWLINLRK